MASGRSKGIKTKDDTWKSEELSKELTKARKSDKPRTTERSGGLKDRSRNPSKESDITGEKRNKHDEKRRVVRESGRTEHSPVTTKRSSSTKLKEKITKETSSPKLAHSPIPKKTQSPKVSHSLLPRKPSELVNSPLIKKKRDKSDKSSHSKEDVVSQSYSSPQRTRRDKNQQGDHTPKQAHHDRGATKLEKKAVAKLKESKEHFDVVQMEEVIEDISQKDGDAHEYSDDQFEEDYEEDFDDEEESDQGPNSPLPPVVNEDIDDIMKAIDSENQDVDQIKSQDSLVEPSAPSSHSLLSPRPPVISFSSPSKHQTVRSSKTCRKMRARADELSHLISTDIMAVSLFELNPQSEYDFYMRSFGTNNSHQTGIQTGCDHDESDTQTDDIIVTDRWTQYPAHDLKGYGGTSSDLMDDELFVQFNLETLCKFIGKAGKVVTDLLEEEEQNSIGQQQSISANEHSDAYCSLAATIGREGSVTCVDWTPTHPDLYLIGYGNGTTIWRGSCELWNVSKSFSPLFYLGNHSIPMACCLSFPLIICGNDDGTLVVWDLREPSSMHKTNNASGEFNKLYRIPTFTTAALGWDSGHNEPILCLNSTPCGSSNDLDWQDRTMKGLSSQVLSMDGSGQVCVWVVVEVSEPDPAGSDTDLGLVPGGKIKLIANSSFRIFDPLLASPYISCACIKDINSNSLLIGTDNGSVVCHIRYKATSSPRTYSASSINVNQTVTAISIHPLFNNYFLVGYSSGHIALYYYNASQPLLLWPSMDSPVKSLHWHSSLPGVFTALCENSDIHIWDLLDNDAQPVHKIKPTNKLISSLPVSFDSEAAMIVCQQSGLIDIYRFKVSKLCHENDKESLQDYLMILRCNLT